MASIAKRSSGKWQARISIKGKTKSIGTFNTKREAQEQAALAEKLFKDENKHERMQIFWMKEIKAAEAALKSFEAEMKDLSPSFALKNFAMQHVILKKRLDHAKESLEIVQAADLEVVDGGIY